MSAAPERPRPACWPTPAQDLLLRAALLPARDALEAWGQWKQATGAAALDPASWRLLPLLYRNLQIHGVEPQSLQLYRRAYERTWAENQFMFEHAAALARKLHDAGIDVLFLKGVALAHVFYADPALRPMSDIDILIRPGQIAAATAVCRQLGWRPLFEPGDLFPLDQGVHFTLGTEFQLDLHWRAFWEFRPSISDDILWDQAIPFRIGAMPARSLNATALLLHVCMHGTQRGELSSIRWAADAMTILRSQHPVDWNMLVDQAAQRRYTQHMLDTLRYLKQTLDAPVPDAALDSLGRSPTTMFDRLFYRAQCSQNEMFRTVLWWQLVAPLRAGSKIPWLERGPALHRYLRAKWGFESRRSIPVQAVARLVRRLLRTAATLWQSQPAKPPRLSRSQSAGKS